MEVHPLDDLTSEIYACGLMEVGGTQLSLTLFGIADLVHYDYGTNFICRFNDNVRIMSQVHNSLTFLFMKVTFFFLSALYFFFFFFCKSSSVDENYDSSWHGSMRLKVDFSFE